MDLKNTCNYGNTSTIMWKENGKNKKIWIFNQRNVMSIGI